MIPAKQTGSTPHVGVGVERSPEIGVLLAFGLFQPLQRLHPETLGQG